MTQSYDFYVYSYISIKKQISKCPKRFHTSQKARELKFCTDYYTKIEGKIWKLQKENFFIFLINIKVIKN